MYCEENGFGSANLTYSKMLISKSLSVKWVEKAVFVEMSKRIYKSYFF